MLKILQARLQQYVNRELPDVQAGFRKGRGTRDQIANICWIVEKTTEFHKNIYFCFIDYAKAFDCVDHNKLWKILKNTNESLSWSFSVYKTDIEDLIVTEDIITPNPPGIIIDSTPTNISEAEILCT